MSDLDQQFRGARLAALGIVAAQAGATLLISGAVLLWGGSEAAVSALLGGSIGTFANLVMVARAFQPGASREPEKILGRLYRGEAFKLLTTAGLFVLVLTSMEVVFGAMIGGFAATLLVFWAALLRGHGDTLAGAPERSGGK